jgi:hypothetical protein
MLKADQRASGKDDSSAAAAVEGGCAGCESTSGERRRPPRAGLASGAACWLTGSRRGRRGEEGRGKTKRAAPYEEEEGRRPTEGEKEEGPAKGRSAASCLLGGRGVDGQPDSDVKGSDGGP